MAVTDITEGTLEGTGIFDSLMRAAKLHLDEEFKKKRFSGEDYANIYLSTMSGVLQQSMSYAVSMEQIASQAALVEAQTRKVESDIALSTEQILLAKEQVKIAQQELLVKQAQVDLAEVEADIAAAKLVNVPKEGALLDAQVTQVTAAASKTAEEENLTAQQKAKVAQETLNLVKVGTKIDKELLLVDADIAVKEENVLLIREQTSNANAEGLNIPKIGLKLDKEATQIEQQTANLVYQGLNVQQQTTNLAAENANIPKQGALIDAQKAKTNADVTVSEAQKAVLDKDALKRVEDTKLVTAQITKTGKESDVLVARAKSENAQTTDVAGGVLGAQVNLYKAQKEGYARDAEQKLAKIFTDAYSVIKTADPNHPLEGSGLTNTDVAAVLSAAKSGIGA